MNLVLCGILTTAAILYCVIFDETLMFNMMMCIFCVLALVSVWTQQNPSEKNENDAQDEEPSEKEELKKQD